MKEVKERNITDMFTKDRMCTYAMILLFPPFGLYRVWRKESDFTRAERLVWTMVELAYVVNFIQIVAA